MGELVYHPHPTVTMVREWVAGLPAATGRALGEWVELVRAEGPPPGPARLAWIKQSHGFGHYAAGWLAERCDDLFREEDDPARDQARAERWVAAQFDGPKRGLLPIYEALLGLTAGLGPEVRVCPAKTIVPFYRKHVFAQVKPATRTRLDLGLALKGVPFGCRLVDTGGLARKDRITHRIALTAPEDLDNEVTQWLVEAYERSS